MSNNTNGIAAVLADYPALGPVEKVGAKEYPLALYAALGWDGRTKPDASKVIINGKRWREVCLEYRNLGGRQASGAFWMFEGPCADDDVPYDKVILKEGAFRRRRGACATARAC